EIDLGAGGVGIAARIAEHAELDLAAVPAVEKCLGDVAAVIHLPLDYPGTGLTLPACRTMRRAGTTGQGITARAETSAVPSRAEGKPGSRPAGPGRHPTSYTSP